MYQWAKREFILLTFQWETSLNALGPIEHSCMAVAAASDATDYSYLTLEPAWGAVHRGGRWASLDLAAMGLQHAERAADPLLKQIATRCGILRIFLSLLVTNGRL